MKNKFSRKLSLISSTLAALGAGIWLALWLSTSPKTESDLLFSLTWPQSNVSPPKPTALKELRGQVLVVNFWATWCAPCVKEMPELDQLRKELYTEKLKGFEIVGIGIDSDEKIQQFLAKTPIQYPLYTAGAAGAELGKQLGNEKGFLPFTVILNADGSIAQRKLGVLNIEELRGQIRQMLRKS